MYVFDTLNKYCTMWSKNDGIHPHPSIGWNSHRKDAELRSFFEELMMGLDQDTPTRGEHKWVLNQK